MALQRYEDLIEMEIEFLQFYHYLIVDGLQMIDFESKQRVLGNVRNAYSKYNLQNGLSQITFDDDGIRSAYIFSYAPCFTGSVVYHFLNLIHSNPWLLEKAIYQGSLTITCLGGGPGAEVVAIARAVELSLKMLCLNAKPVTIHANIVDIDPGWKEIMKRITQKWWKFFDGKYIKLRLSFVQCDLTQSLSEDVKNIVKKSDVITMVHFLSAVYGTNRRENISRMLQEIMDHMNKDGILFYLNSSRFSCVRQLHDTIGTSNIMKVIYGPFYEDSYQVSGPCLRVCFNLYARHFGDKPPQIMCKNNVAAWCKVEIQSE